MPSGILVIEDDADIRRGLCVRLQAHGYSTQAAADAITGHSLALRTKPALILLDLGLPGGDGLALLTKSRPSTTASIPVLVLTGRDPQKHEASALRMGAAGFFQKPPEVDRLIAAIQEQIGDPQPQDRTVSARQEILVVEDDADTRMGLIVRLRRPVTTPPSLLTPRLC